MNSKFIFQLDTNELSQLIKDSVNEAINPLIPKEKKFLYRDEVCTIFGISISTLVRWINDGKITCKKAGRKMLFDREEINNLAKERVIYRYKSKNN